MISKRRKIQGSPLEDIAAELRLGQATFRELPLQADLFSLAAQLSLLDNEASSPAKQQRARPEPETPAFNSLEEECYPDSKQEQALNQLGVCILRPGKNIIPKGFSYGLLLGEDKAFFLYLKDARDVAGLSTAE